MTILRKLTKSVPRLRGRDVMLGLSSGDMMSLNRMTNDRLLNTMTRGKTSRSDKDHRLLGHRKHKYEYNDTLASLSAWNQVRAMATSVGETIIKYFHSSDDLRPF